MSGVPTVVALSGSMRDVSYTRIALRRALAAAEAAGAETELLDLRDYDLPVFDPDEEEPEAAVALMRTVREADAILLGTPVYHGSYSSALKNALDYCGFDEFEDSTVGLLATAGGGSYASTLDHLRVIARTLHAWTLPHQVGIRKAYDEFEDEAFLDEDLEARVVKLGRQLVEYAAIRPRPTPVTPDPDD